MSQPRHGLSATIVETKAGTLVMFAGGEKENGESSDVVDIYNAKTGKWLKPERLSQARVDLATTTIGNKAVFAGGFKHPYPSDVVDVYNGETGKWEHFIMKEKKHQFVAITVGNKVLLAGGSNDGPESTTRNPYFSTAVIYDKTLQGLGTLFNLSVERSLLVVAKVGNKAIFAGGLNNNGPTSMIEIYDGVTGKLGRSNSPYFQ